MNKYSKSGCGPTVKMVNGGSVGLLERLRAGNIDQEGSKAYNTWGAGAKDESTAETSRLSRAAAPAAEPDMPAASPRESVGNMDGMETEPAKASYKASDNYGDRADSAPAKPKPRRRPVATSGPSTSVAGGVAAGLAAGNAARKADMAAASKPAPAKKGFYASASENDPNNGIGKKIKDFFGGSSRDSYDVAKKMANGGVVGGSPGSAKGYGKK